MCTQFGEEITICSVAREISSRSADGFSFGLQNDKKMLSLKVFLPEILAAAEQKVSPSMEVLRTCSVLPWKAVMGAPHLSYTVSDK